MVVASVMTYVMTDICKLLFQVLVEEFFDGKNFEANLKQMNLD